MKCHYTIAEQGIDGMSLHKAEEGIDGMSLYNSRAGN